MDTKSGLELFPIGIGTWAMGGEREAVIDPVLDQQCVDAITYSLIKGQNHIDSAELYGAGHTDELVARAIAGTPREDLFIANKLWEHSLGETQTRDGVARMLDRLETEYIDLLYIHWTFGKEEWKKAVEPINALIDEGIVRYFGVSNFTVEEMQEAQKLSSAPLAANQVEYNVTFRTDATDEFMAYCKDQLIQVVAYKPIDRGTVVANPKISDIAQKHDATNAQVAIAWLLAQQTLVIPKATKKSHIDENLGALSLTLTPEDISELSSLT